jgi:hypothetical protein
VAKAPMRVFQISCWNVKATKAITINSDCIEGGTKTV